MRIRIGLTGLLLSVLVTVGLAQTVSYDYERTANFSIYKTYAWTDGTALPDAFDHHRVVRAIDVALAARGLTQAGPGNDPDVLVAYHASFETNLRISGASQGLGPLGIGPDRWGTATVRPVQVGTLVVDITDARVQRLVWRGLARTEVSATDSPEKRQKKIDRAAAKMFGEFPPKPR